VKARYFGMNAYGTRAASLQLSHIERAVFRRQLAGPPLRPCRWVRPSRAPVVSGVGPENTLLETWPSGKDRAFAAQQVARVTRLEHMASSRGCHRPSGGL